jgi:hypothetical protein
VVVLDVDSTIVLAHSDKQNAAAAYKHTYGFHPILVTCDSTNELLAIQLRAGNAGANTAADHLSVLDAITQIHAPHRWHLLIRGEGAAGTHAVLDWLTAAASSTRSAGRSTRPNAPPSPPSRPPPGHRHWPPTAVRGRRPRWPN